MYNVFFIETPERELITKAIFDTPHACWHYIQRFGEPGWRPKPIEMLNLEEVRALPNRSLHVVEEDVHDDNYPRS